LVFAIAEGQDTDTTTTMTGKSLNVNSRVAIVIGSLEIHPVDGARKRWMW
jgi:hypothetical protein